MARFSAALLVACAVVSTRARAQSGLIPITRAQAVQAAITSGARLGAARADTSLAAAQLLVAGAVPNPTLSTSYSKSEPRYHVAADLPLDFTRTRGARIGAARAGRAASLYRLQSEQVGAALDADTTYTRALATRARLDLSRRNTESADSLRRIAVARRDAGDASDLDVELANVNAGQQANTLAGDSLTFVSTLLDLQSVLGMSDEQAMLMPVDTLGLPPETMLADTARGTVPLGTSNATSALLSIAAAQASLDAATRNIAVEQRSVWVVPSVTAGFETGDPSTPGLLPTVGVAIPLPLLNRNRGPIAVAAAERERARADLTFAQLQNRIETTRARRELANAQGRVARDQSLVASANRVAALSLTAYREGAAPLPSALEAQRNARDVLAQYVDDLASLWIAIAELRALTRVATPLPSTDTPR